MRNNRQRVLRSIAAFAIVIALVLLLVPHFAHHHGIVLTCFLLLPVFLFGKVELPLSLWPIEQIGKVAFRQIVICSSRFQRPPPPAFA